MPRFQISAHDAFSAKRFTRPDIVQSIVRENELPARERTAGPPAESLQHAVVVSGEPAALHLDFSPARGALRDADFLFTHNGLVGGASAAIERCLQRRDGVVIGGLPDLEPLDSPAFFPRAFTQPAFDLDHVSLAIVGVYSHRHKNHFKDSRFTGWDEFASVHGSCPQL